MNVFDELRPVIVCVPSPFALQLALRMLADCLNQFLDIFPSMLCAFQRRFTCAGLIVFPGQHFHSLPEMGLESFDPHCPNIFGPKKNCAVYLSICVSWAVESACR